MQCLQFLKCSRYWYEIGCVLFICLWYGHIVCMFLFHHVKCEVIYYDSYKSSVWFKNWRLLLKLEYKSNFTGQLYFCLKLEWIVLESAAARPRLKLLPRSKPKEETVDAVTTQMRNTSIFGAGKPREAQPDDYVAPTDSTSNPSRSRNTSESHH